MAEKLATDYVEEKVKQANFNEAKPRFCYVTNPDQAESCGLHKSVPKQAIVWFC